MSLFRKTPKQTATVKPSEPSISYPIEVKFWNDHRDGIIQLLDSLEFNIDDMEEGRYATFLKCKLVPNPSNEYDKNAVKVFAAPKGKSKTMFDIGYIPSDIAPYIKADIKKVNAKTHFGSLKMRIDVIYGIDFSLSLKESKY